LARKILLADDSVTAQNMGRKILTDAGYEVITVNNGSAAIKKIADARPDLIVLDVYMPGYSGLEVCQRVKENRDTSQLPVLLTVGKLEPFKQDEARRVRADAFIIKPFEATELLAVLGKLEDKLVAPGPTKVSKSAPNTMENFERKVRDRGPQYGDEDSGWKARLKIPADGPKITEAEPEPAPIPVSSAFRDLAPAPDPNSTTVAAPPLPKDITPDEVAALAAAMGRVKAGDLTEAISDSATTVVAPLHPSDEDAAAIAASPTMGSSGTPQAAEAESTTEPATFAQAEPESREDALAAFAAVPETTAEIHAQAEINAGAPSPAEIEAALSSIPSVQNEASIAQTEQHPSVAAAPVTSGPRWIAEEVPVEAAESVLVLEREMQKAYAAFAAAEHAATYRYDPAPVDREDEPAFAMAPVPIGEPGPVAELASANGSGTEGSQSSAGTDVSPSDLAADLPKPPAPPFAAAAAASGDELGVAAFGTPQPFGLDQEESPRDAVIVEGRSSTSLSDYTVLADTPNSGADGHVSTSVEANAHAEAVASVSEAQREAEIAAATAAAWASWRDIRESLANAKAGADASVDTSGREKPAHEAPDAELELIRQLKGMKRDAATQSGPTPEPLTAEVAAAPEKPSEIASIVDSMLAELRPKLVAEIAKKLGKKEE
jgi:twitching motility two-component system response regulator PilH